MGYKEYKKYTQLEHILARPDTYVGNLNPDVSKQWVFENNEMKQKQCTFVSGLFKIFDEILVNALDQCVVDPMVDKIAVDVNSEDGYVSVLNTGKGVPIVRHADYDDIYVPELIFGNLLTSSNYNDNEQRITGGRNGYGSNDGGKHGALHGFTAPWCGRLSMLGVLTPAYSFRSRKLLEKTC